MTEERNEAPDSTSDPAVLIGSLLALLADEGRGTVLGAAQAAHSGLRRVARPSREFTERFSAAYRAQRPALVRYARRKVGDLGHAEDVVQEAFVKVWRGQEQRPSEIHNLDAYVYTAVANEANRVIRRLIEDRRRLDRDVDGETPSGRSAVGLPEQVADAFALEVALKTLSPREREAVLLAKQWSLTNAEAAQIMKVSEGAVKRYVFDALRRLRVALAT